MRVYAAQASDKRAACSRLDLTFTPAGTDGYEDLAPRAVHFQVFGEDLAVARLEDVLRSKVAADRPKDRQDAMLIRELLRTRQRPKPGP